MEELTLKSVIVKKVSDEWCAFTASGRELARSYDKKLLEDYLKDAL